MDEPGGPLQPGKISELIIEFAQPLVDLAPPRDIETLRRLIHLAVLCWNVPVLERTPTPELQAHLHLFDALPEPILRTLQQLRRDRVTRYGLVPFLITAEVRGTSLADAVVHAEARSAAHPTP